MQSESIGALAAALAKAQGIMLGAAKDAANPFFKSSYADLASVWAACRAPLAANGLSVIQTTGIDADGRAQLITTLAHSSGEWISGHYPVRPVKDDPQGLGSAITYARRYALSAMVGIAPEDDDAEAAMDRNAKPASKPVARPATYPADKFAKFLPTWIESIMTGASSQSIIDKIKTGGSPLTQAQADHLLSAEGKFIAMTEQQTAANIAAEGAE